MYNSQVDKNTIIGDFTHLASNVIITRSQIGNYCSIGPYVRIGLGEHNYTNFSTSVLFSESPYNELTKEKCIIGDDVWIGTNAVILRGVTIGDGAVIGASALITKDVPAFAIAVGIPAKILKYRFSEERIKIIKKSKWWNYHLNKAKLIIKDLENEK